MLILTGWQTAEALPISFTLVANTNTVSPSTGSTFTGLSNPAISAGTVVFRGESDDFRFSSPGIFAYDANGLRVVADQGTATPDPTGAFFDFGTPSVSGGDVAFGARYAPNDQSPSTAGLFIRNASGTALVADTNTISPSTGSVFTSFGDPAISAGTVVFRGESDDFRFSNPGIFAYDANGLRVVADQGTATPDPTGAFFDFGLPSISGANIAFTAHYAPNDQSPLTTGLFLDFGGLLDEIISVGDALDGSVITALGIGRTSVSGNALAFYAEFANGSQAVYRADIHSVPEPSSVLLVLVGVCALLVVRRRPS